MEKHNFFKSIPFGRYWVDACFGGSEPSGTGGRSQDEAKKKKEAGADSDKKPVPAPSANDQAESITDPDSPLTGDTGNREIGKTDLGAGAVGAGNEDKI